MSTSVIYHTGFLAIDRRQDDDLDRRANLLRNRADRGEAILTRRQRRLGRDQWDYIAQVEQ